MSSPERDPVHNAEQRAILDAVQEMRTEVLLSMTRALWEHVTADLRGVAVAYSGNPATGSIRLFPDEGVARL